MTADSPRAKAPQLPAGARYVPWGSSVDNQLRARLRAPGSERSRPAEGADQGPTQSPAQDATWDLIVIGAGITGAGVARDAAMRGLSVLVLEAADVAFGTSSRSTRLIHGGVRYLEQGELGLVYEALRERARLYASAPHLVAPARFVFPTYRGDRLGPWKLRLGLTLYDTLNFFRGQTHDFLRAQACRDMEPLLREDGLKGAVLYEDAVTDDARLTLTVLQDARRHEADVLTYAPVKSVKRAEGSSHLRVELEDGSRAWGRQVVVATGPWTGQRLLGASGKGVLAKSKGIHLVMRASDVPVGHPVVVQAPGDQRRILFVVPWGTRTYLGTTDVPYEGDPRNSGVGEDEERELLETIRHVMPNASLGHENIISAWSGVRPLVRPEGREGNDTVEASRKHRLVYAESGAIGLVGGKLTTFRAMAEEAVDVVVSRLREQWPEGRPAARPCTTAEVPLVPGPVLTETDRTDPLVRDLEGRHGPLAPALAQRATEASADAAARLVDDLPYRRLEIEHAVKFEGARHVADVLRRRLPLALTDPRLGGAFVHATAQALVDERGGSSSDIDEEVERYLEEIRIETRRTPQLDPR